MGRDRAAKKKNDTMKTCCALGAGRTWGICPASGNCTCTFYSSAFS